MSRGRSALKHGLLFGLITLGCSWFVCWGPIAIAGVPTISFVDDTRGPVWAIVLFVFGGFVPSIVALVMTAAGEGKPGLARLFRRFLKTGIGFRWYLAIVGIVVLGTAGQIGVQALLGHRFDLRLFVEQLGSLAPLIILGPISEEFGWRGYMLSKLQTVWGSLTSSLVVGVVWALWHLPLFHMAGSSQSELGLPFLGYAIGLIGISVIMTFLHNGTGGSIWTAVMFHWINTYAMQVVGSGVVRSAVYNYLEYTPYLLIALILIARYGAKRLTPGCQWTARINR